MKTANIATSATRNRLASDTLSPVLIPFLDPHGKLHQTLPTNAKLLGSMPPLLTTQDRPGPKQTNRGTPSQEWPQGVHSVLEHHEPLRQVASGYGVSHETVRRLLRTSRNNRAG